METDLVNASILLMEIERKIKSGKPLTKKEREAFLSSTGEEMPDKETSALDVIDSVFTGLEKVVFMRKPFGKNA